MTSETIRIGVVPDPDEMDEDDWAAYMAGHGMATSGSTGWATPAGSGSGTGSDGDDGSDETGDESGSSGRSRSPTHICTGCWDNEQHIESSPSRDRRWCRTDGCESVTVWLPLDDPRVRYHTERE